mmetsp:Transcript_23375/g.71598  ORF Transcript_23375/g.71598 Transcript_23375/m.71598 type:complete len:214 (+) Transcript_23375:371-1012(+)
MAARTRASTCSISRSCCCLAAASSFAPAAPASARERRSASNSDVSAWHLPCVDASFACASERSCATASCVRALSLASASRREWASAEMVDDSIRADASSSLSESTRASSEVTLSTAARYFAVISASSLAASREASAFASLSLARSSWSRSSAALAAIAISLESFPTTLSISSARRATDSASSLRFSSSKREATCDSKFSSHRSRAAAWESCAS